VDSRPAAASGWDSLYPRITSGHRAFLADLDLVLVGFDKPLLSGADDRETAIDVLVDFERRRMLSDLIQS
jgi:hypothetical protein